MLFLLQDGITNGAIYALLGLALVLVFAVTRVILIPQGEFVTYGALSYAMAGHRAGAGTARLAVAMGLVRSASTCSSPADHSICGPSCAPWHQRRPAGGDPRPHLRSREPEDAGFAVNIALALLIVAAIGLFLYRIAFNRSRTLPYWCC